MNARHSHLANFHNEFWWKRFLDSTKREWSKLSDRDVCMAEDNLARLADKFRELYGMTDDEAMQAAREVRLQLQQGMWGAEVVRDRRRTRRE